MKTGVSLLSGALVLNFFLCTTVPAVVAENYPNFEYSSTSRSTSTSSSSEGKEEAMPAAEWTSVTEFAKVKPNNYPNFAFTKPSESATETGSSSSSSRDIAATAAAATEVKPNNYPNFEFKDSSDSAPSFYSTRPSSTSSSSSYRGSDPLARFPSSFDLTNSRHQASSSDPQQQQFFDASWNTQQQKQAPAAREFFSSQEKPFDDRSSAYRFNGAAADNMYNSEQQTTSSSSSSFPDVFRFVSSSSSTATGRGCSSSYWSSHLSKWPSFFSIDSKVSDAFPGGEVRVVYGTTTLLQALYDTRADGYSKLGNHGVAALLNAYEMTSWFQYSHVAVIELFTGSLSSRAAAAEQALLFQQANTVYGPQGCNA